MDRLRTCIVKGRPAYFHRWSDKSNVIPPSVRSSGHKGGIVAQTVGIIEYENGVVTECYPYEIKFTNRFINDMEEEIIQSEEENKS